MSSVFDLAAPAADPGVPGLTDPVAVIVKGGLSFGAPDDVSSDSSSIGSPSSSEDEDEAESKSSSNPNNESTSSSSGGSLSLLMDSLPLKKGLSNHYNGRSRSLSNFSNCAGGNAEDFTKPEHPINKRRRIQIASKLSYKRRASCSSLMTTMLAVPENAEEEGDDGDSDDDGGRNGGSSYDEKIGKAMAAVKSPRSYPLFDLRYG